MSRPPEKCAHGLSMDPSVYCAMCEIVWHEEGLRDAEKSVARHTRKLEAARAASGVAGTPAPLSWLAENKNCELSYDYGDADEDGKGWCVHRVNGGYNDREWTLIGTGETPEAALLAALSADTGSREG